MTIMVPANPDHCEYYEFLEKLRKSGIVNMWGATPYLYSSFDELSLEEASDILTEWISNYDKLNDEYHWNNP